MAAPAFLCQDQGRCTCRVRRERAPSGGDRQVTSYDARAGGSPSPPPAPPARQVFVLDGGERRLTDLNAEWKNEVPSGARNDLVYQ
jgi:hypothetical protein